MPPPIFPLRWASTGEQWWYASPIDCAAANGYYDLVTELLHTDPNLLINLTSLPRIQRLEMVWDDQDQFHDVAKCRAHVARSLLLDCESKAGFNSLVRAGYGGWILYTAASAGDLGFVKDLLERNPLLVFGEGEYGITLLLYAAARSKSCEVFKLMLNFAFSLKSFGGDEAVEEERGELAGGFKQEMMNRAIHALARGGNLELLKELLMDHSDDDVVSGFRDGQGSTILHTAAGRGQAEVVKHLIFSYGSNIMESTDQHGNTALHIAAYRGSSHVVVELLLLASPLLAPLKNNQGDTFLHMAVAGFQAPGFRRIDQQIHLMEQLTNGSIIIRIQDLINVQNNQGKTALHLAVGDEIIQPDVVELLMTEKAIDLNIQDHSGLTPLDLLKQHSHQNTSSELLIKKMVSLGGISSSSLFSYEEDDNISSTRASHPKLQGYICSSPGTSFRVPDSEMFLYSGNASGSEEEEACSSIYDVERSDRFSVGWSQGGLSHLNSPLARSDSFHNDTEKLKSSANSAARRLKELLQWPRKKDRKRKSNDFFELMSQSFDKNPIPLRERFCNTSSTANNKRNTPIRCEFPSPTDKKKLTNASLMQDVIRQHSMVKMRTRAALSEANSPLRSHSPRSVDSSSPDLRSTGFAGRSSGKSQSLKQSFQEEVDESILLLWSPGVSVVWFCGNSVSLFFFFVWQPSPLDPISSLPIHKTECIPL